MGLKERVMELLQSADLRSLERLVVDEPRAARYLIGRLWDADEVVRRRAAHGLGAAAAGHPELGRELLRRLVWALNDESATNGVYGLAAIGEIGARAPDLVAPFVGPVASFMGDEGLRLEILTALARIADTAPRLVLPVLDDVAARVDSRRADELEAWRELEMKVTHDDA
jgi:hypothetical protein